MSPDEDLCVLMMFRRAFINKYDLLSRVALFNCNPHVNIGWNVVDLADIFGPFFMRFISIFFWTGLVFSIRYFTFVSFNFENDLGKYLWTCCVVICFLIREIALNRICCMFGLCDAYHILCNDRIYKHRSTLTVERFCF